MLLRARQLELPALTKPIARRTASLAAGSYSCRRSEFCVRRRASGVVRQPAESRGTCRAWQSPRARHFRARDLRSEGATRGGRSAGRA
eukprot:4526026-Prymnesium_polylepis.1